MSLELVEYDPSYLERLVPLWREAFEFGVGVVEPHSISEQREYFLAQVLPKHRVTLALLDARFVGFIAASEESVAQLHVQVGLHRQGIGSALLALSKARSKGSLWLYAFTVTSVLASSMRSTVSLPSSAASSRSGNSKTSNTAGQHSAPRET